MRFVFKGILVCSSLGLVSICSTLSGIAEQARQQSVLSWTPIAIAPLATFGGVAVLTRTGDVFAVGSLSSTPPSTSIGHIASGDPIDLGAGSLEGKDLIAVCSTAHTNADPGQAALTVFEVQAGKTMSQVARPMKTLGATTCSGVFVDGRSGTAFATDMFTGKVHSLSLRSGGDGRVAGTFVSVPNALGTSLTLDLGRPRFLVADEQNGGIIEVPMEGRSPARVVVTDLGDPRAVWVDQPRSRLLIADATFKKIWQVAIDRNTGALGHATVFSAEASFREPSGLAVDGSGTVWVGDPSAQVVYRFSPSGNLVGKVSAPR